MGTYLTRGHNYSDGDTVTPANIHALVDDATVTAQSIGNAELGLLSVAAGNIQTDAVETAKIKDANVTTAKLADSSVTFAKLSPTVRPGVIPFTPATPLSTGEQGLVPAPQAGAQNSFLRGDGSWRDLIGDVAAEVTSQIAAEPTLNHFKHLNYQ